MKPTIKISYVDEDYFNLDTIIATNSNIMCSFDKSIPADFFPLMGQRAPDSLADKGFRTGIMAWIVPAVDSHCVLTIPTAYNAVTRDVINAGAQVANFERIQRHFYALGAYVCRLIGGEEGRSIASALLAAYTQRVGWILRRAIDTAAKPSQMDETEKLVFRIGQRSERQMHAWMRGEERHKMRRKRAHPDSTHL